MLLSSRPGWSGAEISLDELECTEIGSELQASNGVCIGCSKEKCLVFIFYPVPGVHCNLDLLLVQSHFSDLLLYCLDSLFHLIFLEISGLLTRTLNSVLKYLLKWLLLGLCFSFLLCGSEVGSYL